jgi:MYXO-CTERM domain-containing protein
MHRRRSIDGFRGVAVAAVGGLLGSANPASAEFASSVQSFSQGTVAFADGVSTYNNPATALGQPNRIAGASIGFPGPVTAFNPPFEQTEMVSVGLGGQVTLELSTAVATNSGALQIGIFHSAGLNDPTFSGQSENPARTFAGREFGADRTAVVEVADALGNFHSLGRVLFTQPTQGYANQSDPYAFPAPPAPSNFDQPFAGGLGSFDGLNQSQISTMLQSSAGGTWIAMTPAVAAALDEIRFVRISDPMWQAIGSGALEATRTSAFDPDGPTGPQQPFVKPADLFVDGVNVVPEPTGIAVLAVLGTLAGRRRRS